MLSDIIFLPVTQIHQNKFQRSRKSIGVMNTRLEKKEQERLKYLLITTLIKIVL